MKNTSRRQFVKRSVLTALASTLSFPVILKGAGLRQLTSGHASMDRSGFLPGALKFEQVKLPYAYNALEPNIDAMTMELHYTKHHAGYVKNINDAIADEKISYASDADLFAHASKLSAKARNNSGGAWNHNFFWESMAPGAQAAGSKVMDALNGAFGSFDKFKEQLTSAAIGRFGSGWAWLVSDMGKLKIGSTPNQDNPMMDVSELKGTPLLAIDVWEHAYYLKYQNRRNEYVANWWNTVNWEAVAKRMA